MRNAYDAGKKKFCSIQCRDAAWAIKPRDTRVDILCANCSTVVRVFPSKVGRRKFCSRRCAGIGKPLNFRPSVIATAASEIIVQRLGLLAIAEMRVEQWSIDLAFPLQQIALELDGIFGHNLPGAHDRDDRKDARLIELGWKVIRVVMTQRATPETVANVAIAALAEAGKSPHRKKDRRTA